MQAVPNLPLVACEQGRYGAPYRNPTTLAGGVLSRFSIRPLSDNFGVEITGVNLASDVDAPTLEAIAEAYLEHKVVLFRDQNLSAQRYVQFAFSWGEPRNDAFSELQVSTFKDLSMVGNTGDLLEQTHYRNGSCYWHTDCAAEPDPNATTMLYCLHAPSVGGETVVADMQQAYDALDAPTKKEIDGLIARHAYSGTCDTLDGREAWEIPFPEVPVKEVTVQRLPSHKRHPLVRRHSVSDRSSLYAPAGSIVAVEGLAEQRAHELVRRLKLHAVQSQFVYSHRYQPGDLLMWDNSATLHRAGPVGVPGKDDERRLLYRIVPTGIPKPLRTQVAAVTT